MQNKLKKGHIYIKRRNTQLKNMKAFNNIFDEAFFAAEEDCILGRSTIVVS